jgi:hypothetical protein
MSERSLWHDVRAFTDAHLAGHQHIDAWGFDRTVYDLAARAAELRWRVEVVGGELLPASGPALLVLPEGAPLSAPAVIAVGVHRVTGRRVRPVGIPDVVVLGPLLRRLGGVLDAPAELRGLLRAGEVLAVRGHHLEAVDAALRAGAPVLEVAVHGHDWGWAWRVEVGGR